LLGLAVVILVVLGVGSFLGYFLLMRGSRKAGDPNELADIREDVAQLREEVERLKRQQNARGSTDIKEL